MISFKVYSSSPTHTHTRNKKRSNGGKERNLRPLWCRNLTIKCLLPNRPTTQQNQNQRFDGTGSQHKTEARISCVNDMLFLSYAASIHI